VNVSGAALRHRACQCQRPRPGRVNPYGAPSDDRPRDLARSSETRLRRAANMIVAGRADCYVPSCHRCRRFDGTEWLSPSDVGGTLAVWRSSREGPGGWSFVESHGWLATEGRGDTPRGWSGRRRRPAEGGGMRRGLGRRGLIPKGSSWADGIASIIDSSAGSCLCSPSVLSPSRSSGVPWLHHRARRQGA
jgi:hypothetical protein